MPELQKESGGGVRTFVYAAPQRGERAKKASLLARSGSAMLLAQTVGPEGANNLHSHTFADGFWLVMRGRARFYTADDQVLAELEPHDGIVIPREFPYWFESAGDEDLELLQFETKMERPPGDTRPNRVDYEVRRHGDDVAAEF